MRDRNNRSFSSGLARSSFQGLTVDFSGSELGHQQRRIESRSACQVKQAKAEVSFVDLIGINNTASCGICSHLDARKQEPSPSSILLRSLRC